MALVCYTAAVSCASSPFTMHLPAVLCAGCVLCGLIVCQLPCLCRREQDLLPDPVQLRVTQPPPVLRLQQQRAPRGQGPCSWADTWAGQPLARGEQRSTARGCAKASVAAQQGTRQPCRAPRSQAAGAQVTSPSPAHWLQLGAPDRCRRWAATTAAALWRCWPPARPPPPRSGSRCAAGRQLMLGSSCIRNAPTCGRACRGSCHDVLPCGWCLDCCRAVMRPVGMAAAHRRCSLPTSAIPSCFLPTSHQSGHRRRGAPVHVAV